MNDLIESFSQAFLAWDGMGQFLFILIILGGIGALIKMCFYYMGIWLHGWPPAHINSPDDEE